MQALLGLGDFIADIHIPNLTEDLAPRIWLKSETFLDNAWGQLYPWMLQESECVVQWSRNTILPEVLMQYLHIAGRVLSGRSRIADNKLYRTPLSMEWRFHGNHANNAVIYVALGLSYVPHFRPSSHRIYSLSSHRIYCLSSRGHFVCLVTGFIVCLVVGILYV